ncbi:ATP-binding protein [Bradyrhizobium sp. PUT101]|uniref:ATP-binding protein n=1 Tax=Bradyrhizobium sp. PUT101 TaxID=3447427 RepID=UPI003F862661
MVDDEGPGVPVGQRDILLEPFVRLEQSRNRCTGGAGLGLAVVRSLVEVCGGPLPSTMRHLAARASPSGCRCSLQAERLYCRGRLSGRDKRIVRPGSYSALHVVTKIQQTMVRDHKGLT